VVYTPQYYPIFYEGIANLATQMPSSPWIGGVFNHVKFRIYHTDIRDFSWEGYATEEQYNGIIYDIL
jgi:hypothetical protein